MMERLKQATGADLTCIPYRGSPPALLALLKNEIQVFPIGLAAVGTSFGEGRLAALAVATKERLPMLPDVPSIAESGFPGLVASNWFGMAAPAGTPGRCPRQPGAGGIRRAKDHFGAGALYDLGYAGSQHFATGVYGKSQVGGRFLVRNGATRKNLNRVKGCP